VAFASATPTAKGIPGCVPSISGTLDFCMEWNAEGQLKRITLNGNEVARFSYDPKGRRVEKVASGVTTSYLYAGEDILREVRGTTTLKYVHGRGFDEPLAREDSAGALTYFHTDGLGSIVKLTNQAGAVAHEYRYDAWGSVEAGANEPGYAFTGREWDPGTGLYYYRARYYDPKIGRFISEDPARFRGGPNPYSYVFNNPVIFADPHGDVPVLVGIGLGAAGVLAATGVAVVVFYPEYAPGWLKTVVTSLLPLGPAVDAIGPEVPDAAIKIKQRREEELRLLCSMEPCAVCRKPVRSARKRRTSVSSRSAVEGREC
jgi:RHS repeat-associated protein